MGHQVTYWSPRPVNAIRDLGLDPNWTPLLPTPDVPGFVSGHSGYSAAAAEVLSYFFPGERGVFQAKAHEAALSRLYAGIHRERTTSSAPRSATRSDERSWSESGRTAPT